MSLNEISDTEKKDDKAELDVHSANSWETADLGDKSRHDKFLRLMGAAKKEHHGRFVIGDQDGKHRAKSDEKHRADELEDQYKHSMEHTLAGGKKGHLGLGFHDDDDKAKEKDEGEGEDDDKAKEKDKGDDKKEESGDAKPADEKGDSDSDVKEKATCDGEEHENRKRESVDKSEPAHEEVKKMKFVKSSS